MDENEVHGNNISTTIVYTNDMTTHNADCFDSLKKASSYRTAEASTNAIVVLTGSRDTHLVASDDDNLLSSKELLGDNTGQTTEEVVATVDNFGIGEHHGSFVLQ